MNPNRGGTGSVAGEVEHLGGGDPAAGELDQRGGDGEQRVGAGEGAVGEPHPQPVGRVAAVGVGDDVGEPEPGRDQRRERLDVGAHHEDVARLEGRVVLEQPDQHLAQHVDLAGRRRGRRAPGRLRSSSAWTPRGALVGVGACVGAEVGLQPAEQGGRASRRGSTGVGVAVGRPTASVRRSSRVSRPSEASSGWSTRVGGVVVGARHRRRRGRRRSSQSRGDGCGSQRWTSRCSPSAAQQLDLGDRAAGCGRTARAAPGRSRPSPPARSRAERLGVPDVGRRLVDARDAAAATARPASSRSSSSAAAGAVGVAALAPVGDQARPLHGVRREEAGQPPGDGVAAVAAQLALVAVEPVAEVGGEGRAPRLVEAGVDHLEQRPDQPVGVPRVVALAAEQHRDQRARVEEPHPRADAVAAARRRCRAGGESRWVSQRSTPLAGTTTTSSANGSSSGRRQQLAEGVGELVGARCAVEVGGARRHDRPARPTRSPDRRARRRWGACARIGRAVRRPAAGP